MEAVDYLGRSRLFRRLKNGLHGQHVERYAIRLVEEGFAPQGTWRCLNVVSGLLDWIAKHRFKVADIDEHMVERYLQAGVDCSVIALWLGHESIETTQTYLHAHLALKEAALEKLKPYERGKRTRFRPNDRLLTFLEAL
jgi:integrase